MKKISHHFASVLLEVALNEKSATEVLTDLNDLEKVFKDKEIREFFGEPVVPKSAKKEIVLDLLKDRRPEVLNLFVLLIENDQFSLIDEIIKQYELLYNDAFKRIEVHITSAYQLDENQLDSIKQAIDARFEIDSILDVEIDSTLIQGINIRMGDIYYESSLRKSLEELGHHLRKEVNNVA